MKEITLDVDLYVLGSVQEEVGERGARTGAYAINPDWCVAVDVDHAKSPDGREYWLKEIGGGVVISKGTILNRHLTELSIRLAEEKGIKYQLGVEAGGYRNERSHVPDLPGGRRDSTVWPAPQIYAFTRRGCQSRRR